MNVIRKDATITNTGSDDDFPGSFQVVLSAPTEDRDGETLLPGDWKMPLPDHITFDTDHGMTVASTVGSGAPSLDADGRLIVDGTYSSLPRAQEARTLVRERHIRTTSVAFMKVKANMKDGRQRTVRELLNGAFVAIPSNRESVVLNSKGIDAKSGARHSAQDMKHIQMAHDALTELGATCLAPDGDVTLGKAISDAELKGKYSAEQLRQMLAKGEAMKGPDGSPSYPIGDTTDLSNAIHAVGRGGADHDSIRAYIIRRAKALGASDQIPAGWNADGSMKSFKSVDPGNDTGDLAQAVDAALDEAQRLIDQVDVTTLPEPVQQALGLITAAENAIDKLLDVLGVPDPDDPNGDDESAPAAKAAPAADDEEAEMKAQLSNRSRALQYLQAI